MTQRLSRRLFLAGAPLAVAGCASEPVWAPQSDVARAAYRHPGPPALTLFTTRNVGSGNGAHTGLMVNASQRVLFDPAGTFGAPSLPERNDVIFGVTPRVVEYYTGYHARTSYYVVEQRRGMLLIWNNMGLDGKPNENTLHAGSPVIRGTKYIITKWFRLNRWR